MPLEAYQSEQFNTTGLLISLLVQKYCIAPAPQSDKRPRVIWDF